MEIRGNKPEGYLETRHRLKYGNFQTAITYIKSTLSVVIFSTPYYFSYAGFFATTLSLVVSVILITWSNIRGIRIADWAEDQNIENEGNEENRELLDGEEEEKKTQKFGKVKMVTSLQELPKTLEIPFENFFFVISFLSSFS